MTDPETSLIGWMGEGCVTVKQKHIPQCRWAGIMSARHTGKVRFIHTDGLIFAHFISEEFTFIKIPGKCHNYYRQLKYANFKKNKPKKKQCYNSVVQTTKISAR